MADDYVCAAKDSVCEYKLDGACCLTKVAAVWCIWVHLGLIVRIVLFFCLMQPGAALVARAGCSTGWPIAEWSVLCRFFLAGCLTFWEVIAFFAAA